MPQRIVATVIGLVVATGVLQASSDPDVLLPPTLTGAGLLRPALEKMRRSSPTFRRQCRRLAGVPHLRVNLLLEDLSRRPTYRARAAMTYRDGLLVSVNIHLTTFGDPVELIAHELEHVIEQLDAIDLDTHVRTGMAWKREDGAFETRRATEIGRRVAREVGLTMSPQSLAMPQPGWTQLYAVAQQQAFANMRDPASGRVSADGRYVVLASNARLSPVDDNTTSDIYVVEVATRSATLETPGADGGPANGSSVHADISADGRYIVFESTAGNLTQVELAPGVPRVYWRDRETGITRVLSATPSGEPADGLSNSPVISADGETAVFVSSSTNLLDDPRASGGIGVYRVELSSNRRSRVDVTPDGVRPAGQGTSPAVSGDGRLVAFASTADLTMAAGSDRREQRRDDNGVFDVYVRDVLEARTRRISVGADGNDSDGPSYHPAISIDGRHLAFVSEASNLTSPRRRAHAQVFVSDIETGAIELVSRAPGSGPGNAPSVRPAISGDGSTIAYQSLASNLLCEKQCQAGDLDINLLWDVYVHDRRTRHTIRSSTEQADEWMDSSRGPSLAATGHVLTFASTHPGSEDEGHDEDLFVLGLNRQ